MFIGLLYAVCFTVIQSKNYSNDQLCSVLFLISTLFPFFPAVQDCFLKVLLGQDIKKQLSSLADLYVVKTDSKHFYLFS